MRAHAGRRIVERTLADAIAELPVTAELAIAPLANPDILVTVLGFEERCLAVPSALAASGMLARAAVICRYPTNRSDNVQNEVRLKDCLERIAPGSILELDMADDIAGPLREIVEAHSDAGPPRVCLDISVASNSTIMRALSVLVDCDIDLHLLYAEADVYRPTRDEFDQLRDAGHAEDAQLAKGVLEVTTVSDLPGRHDVGVPNHLVVFPGFDTDRVRAAISQVDNDFIVEIDRAPLTWMVGQPLHEEDRWRQDALVQLHGIPPHHEQHVVSTFDYRETMHSLEDVYAAHGLETNLTVVPLGSKMQAVGITLFCYARPDVAAVVAQPREYSAVQYSRGARQLWHLPLGQATSLLRSLRTVGTITMQPLNGCPR